MENAHMHTHRHTVQRYIDTHTSLQTHSPAPIQIFTSPPWADGQHFKSKNNKAVRSLFIYYLALHNTEVPINAMCCHPFRMEKGEERLRGKKKPNME